MHTMRRNYKRITILGTYGVIYVGGAEFLFDLEDLPLIESRNWFVDKSGYLASCYWFGGARRFAWFHRIVMKAEQGQTVDHINQERWDNRKKNLRICSHAENDRNKGLYSSNKSGYTGVHYDAQRKRWVASITYNRRKILIGRFIVKEDAIQARLAKESELFKEFAPQRGR